jgi:hypothetical protein
VSPFSPSEKESLARQFDRAPSASLHGDKPPASDPRNECGVELPDLRLFLFALKLSSSSFSASEPNANGSSCWSVTFFFSRAMRLDSLSDFPKGALARIFCPKNI